MKINTIELEGYSSYKEYTIINIPEGVTGIVGIFDDNANKSNGSGKSSLVMAILYALYGEGEADTLSEFINDECDSMYVRINFDLNGINYTVERGIKKKNSYLDFFQEHDPNKRFGDNIPTTQEEINRIIGMNYNMLTAANFLEQGEMDKFINPKKTGPDERRNYIDKVLGLDLWRTISKDTNKDIRKFDENLEVIKDTLDNLSGDITKITTDLLEKSTIELQLRKVTDERDNLQKEIDDFMKIKDFIDSLLVKKTLLQSKNDHIKQLEEKLVVVTERKVYTKNCVDMIKIIDNSKELSELQAQLNSELEILNKEKENHSNVSNDIQNVLVQQAKQQEAIKNLESQKSELFNGICPITNEKCEQINTENIKKRNDEITEEIQKYLDLIDKGKSINIDKTIEKITSEQKIDSITNKIKNLETETNKIKTDEEVQSKNLKSERKALEMYEKDFEEYTSEIKKLNELITQITADIQALEEKIPKVTLSNTEFDEKIQGISQANKMINSYSITLGTFAEKEKQLEILKNKVKDEEEKLTFFKDEKLTYEALSDIFINIPRQIFNESVIAIEQYANELIHEFYPNLNVKIYEDTAKKNLPIIIGFEKKGNYRSYKRLSGGQKTVANIAIRLGFSKVIALKTQTNIRFIVMDEPFGALDGENRNLIKKILTLISESFNQILVITHTEDSENFPNIITVRMTPDEISYIN
ncbi:MAG TPA: SMC family ATPase [Methanofastidiosum sp.]|nr:SMC family ATPase [Methanofastidiosum sp.]